MKKKSEVYFDGSKAFEPSVETKKYWRKTRKVTRKYGNLKFPGLFNTIQYRTDITMLIFIALLEVAGLYLLGAAVRFHSLIFWGVTGAVFMDFVLVFWAHALTGMICEYKNRKLVAKYEKNDPEKKRLRNKIFLLTLATKVPAYAIILFIALGKMYFFIDANGGFDSIIDPLTGAYDLKFIVVFTIYALIFVLHVVFSGYAIHGYIFRKKLTKEYGKFVAAEIQAGMSGDNGGFGYSQNRIAGTRVYPISNGMLMTFNISELVEIEGTLHSLIQQLDGSYHLKTWSILQDDDLYSMSVGIQKTKRAKEFLAIQGLKHQLELLYAAP